MHAYVGAVRSDSRQQSVLEIPASGVALNAVARFEDVELVSRGDAVALDTGPRLAFSVEKAMVR